MIEVIEKEAFDYTASLEEACEDAEARGLTVVDAGDDELFVDLDTKTSLAIYRKRVETLMDKGIATSERVTRSSGGHWHGYVQLAESKPVIERIALQAILGSDPTHEYLSYLTYLVNGEKTRIVFFEPNPEVKA